MFRNKSIAFRLSFVTILSAALIFFGQFIYFHIVSRNIVINRVEDNSENIIMSAIYRIQSNLETTEKIAIDMANFIEICDMDEAFIRDYLKNTVAKHENIFGGTFAFESFPQNGESRLFCPYYFDDKGNIKYADLANTEYNYQEWEWYKLPKKMQKPMWSDPYFDEGGGNILMTTYSKPFYKYNKGQKVFSGVLTCDIPLKWIQEMLNAIEIYKTGYAFLVDQDGTIIAHPNKDIIMSNNIFNYAEENNDTHLKEISQDMLSGNSDFVPYESLSTGKDGYISYKYIPEVRWGLAMFFPKDEFLAENTDLGNRIILLGLIGFGLILIAIVLATKTITRPLTKVVRSVEEFSKGNILQGKQTAEEYLQKIEKDPEEIQNIASNNEIIRLFISIKKMAENLAILIGEVKSSGIKVKTSTTEINASIKEFEATVAEQAASTKEVSSTSSQIKQPSEELAKNMNNVSISVDETTLMAETGRNKLQEMESELQQLIKATNSISSKLDMISNKADKISGVVTTINEISDQTNLLSLNAAIEAEKAEEYGKGFAVVAREISRLSDQTAIATKDIEYMVNEMHSAVSSGVMEMDSFGEQVSRSVTNTGKITDQLGSVIDRVNILKPEFESVNQVMQSQQDGAAQIKDAMEQLSITAENTKQSLSEFAEATNQLNEAVGILQNEVLRFNID